MRSPIEISHIGETSYKGFECDLLQGLCSRCPRPTSHTNYYLGVGTFNYMPPEQFDETSYKGFKCDMWSLACTLIHMVTGQPPMADLNLGQIMKKVSSLKSVSSQEDADGETLRGRTSRTLASIMDLYSFLPYLHVAGCLC